MGIVLIVVWVVGCGLIYGFVEENWKDDKAHEASKTSAGVLGCAAWTAGLVWIVAANPFSWPFLDGLV